MGGIANSMMELLPSYEKIKNLKISIITKYSEYTPKTDKIKIYQIFRFVKSKINTIYFFIKSFFKIIQIHKRDKIHVINIPSYYYDSFPMLLVRLIFKVPLFIKTPSDFETQQREIFMREESSLLDRIAYYGWMKFYRKFIIKRERIYFQALNKKIYKSLIRLGISDNKVVKIPNGISAEKYTNIKKIPRDHINYGFVGRLYKNKNITALLKAYREYLERNPEDKLLFYGKGPEKQTIKNFIETYDLSDSVYLCGFEKDKLKMYKNIDVLIHPSFGEGCPNTILEAALTETFIIASNVSGINDIINHKSSGLLFNPFKKEDILQQLINYKNNLYDSSKIERKAKNIVISKYDVDHVSRDLYKFLLSKLSKTEKTQTLDISILTLVFPYPNSGALPGVENYIRSVAVPIKKLGHRVKIITTYWNGKKKYDTYKGIPIIRVSDSRRFLGKIGCAFHLNNITFGLNLLRKKNLKYFYNSDLLILPLAIGFVSLLRLKKRNIISTFLHYDEPRSFIDFLTLPFYHFIEKRQLKKNKKIITISETSKKEIKKHYGISGEKIKVFPIGVNTNKFNPQQRDPNLRKKYGPNILLYVGPIIYRKRIPVLFKAIHYIINDFKITDFHLLIIGDGPLLDEYIQLSKKLDLTDHITFLGFVSDKFLPKYYASSDLFVFPSELEGFGQVILEAMASGIPPLCANRPPMSKIVKNEKMLFKTNDSKDLAKKIVKILNSQSYYEDLKSFIDKRVQKYKQINIAKKWVEFCQKNN